MENTSLSEHFHVFVYINASVKSHYAGKHLRLSTVTDVTHFERYQWHLFRFMSSPSLKDSTKSTGLS